MAVVLIPTPGADPLKLFFFVFDLRYLAWPFYCRYTQAYQRKTEKFFATEEKEFYRIGSYFLQIPRTTSEL